MSIRSITFALCVFSCDFLIKVWFKRLTNTDSQRFADMIVVSRQGKYAFSYLTCNSNAAAAVVHYHFSQNVFSPLFLYLAIDAIPFYWTKLTVLLFIYKARTGILVAKLSFTPQIRCQFFSHYYYDCNRLEFGFCLPKSR